MKENGQTKNSPTTKTELNNINHLSASKIADQFWCEMQLHLKLLYGMEPTEEMIAGTRKHRELEEELGPVIEIIAETKQDQQVLYILQIYQKLQMLLHEGITRELPVVGFIGNFPCFGVIDQIQTQKTNDGQKELMISDYKTRYSNRAPSFEQKRRNRIQLQVYWQLLNQLITQQFTEKMYRALFDIPKNLTPTKEFIYQLPDEIKKLLQKLNPSEMLQEIFNMYQELPTLSEELQAIYLYKDTQKIVLIDRTFFHKESFEVDINWALGYWTENREPDHCIQPWMCNFCPFTKYCSYYNEKITRKKGKDKKTKD